MLTLFRRLTHPFKKVMTVIRPTPSSAWYGVGVGKVKRLNIRSSVWQKRVWLDLRYSELQVGHKFKYINGRANTTGIENLGVWCRHGVRARNGRAGVGRAQRINGPEEA